MGSRKQRLYFFDTLRGFSVISMVLFHLSYDLYFLWGQSLPYFEPPFRDIWRASISWTFLIIAGLMCNFSRNNLRRAAKYAVVAFLIYIVTLLAAVDIPISFGIIFCMAASSFLAWLLEKARCFGKADLVHALILFVLFLLTLNLKQAIFGISDFSLKVPAALYSTPWLSWLGFPGPDFASGDYYPLIPYSLLFLSSAHLGAYVLSHKGFPPWCTRKGPKLLNAAGRHALAIYVIHQPAILLLCQLLLG
jgi:uncharacterized membrane protein